MARLLLIRHGESQWNVEGRVQGRTVPEIAAVDRERLLLWTEAPGRVRMPNGERLFDVRRRSRSAVAALASRHGRETVAVVSHEVVIKVVVAEVLGLDYDHLSRLAIDNAALTIIAYAGESSQLLTLNDTAHLAELW